MSEYTSPQIPNDISNLHIKANSMISNQFDTKLKIQIIEAYDKSRLLNENIKKCDSNNKNKIKVQINEI